jgi:CRP/FNR family transcriptional regulator
MISHSSNVERTYRVDGERKLFLPSEHTNGQGSEPLGLLDTLLGAGAATVRRRYDRGDIIYGQGEPSGALYFITEGVVKLAKTYSGGKVATLRLLGPQDVLGNLALGKETLQRARAEAFTACEVVKIPRIFVERAVKRNSEVAFELLTLLGRELVRHEEWAKCLLPYKAEARLANLLPILARTFGEETGGFIIRLRLTHEELSEMIASSRESVTNAMKGLRERGVLETKRGHIVILEPNELAEVARRQPCNAGLLKRLA